MTGFGGGRCSPSGNKLDFSVMAMGSCKSPVAGDERRTEALGESDVHTIGYGVSIPQLIGPPDECLCGPGPHRQGPKVCNRDESFMVADQLTQHRSAYRSDHFDVEVGRHV